MPITRRFLGLDQPPLRLAAEYLLDRFSRGSILDMSPAIMVLPGAQAGRRLLEILVELSDQRQLVLTPPTIETVGRLPENLYRPQRPFAGDLVQQLVWATALQTAEAEILRTLIAHPPSREDSLSWLELGDLLRQQHAELAADGLNFADVAARLQADQPASEAARWRAFDQIQTAYLRTLDSLELWDVQTARLVAIEKQECTTASQIVLIGAVDLNLTLRKMIDLVAAQVTALIFAPPAWSRRFDEHGCLNPAAWEHAEIELANARVHLVEGSADQADQVARCVANYSGAYRADEITIGLPDEQLAPHVQRQLQQCGLPSRSAAGVPLDATRPYRLLSAAADYLQSQRFEDFAALVRHPDVGHWFEHSRKVGPDWLDQLDGYRSEYFSSGVSERSEEAERRFPAFAAACRAIERLLQPLQTGPRPLAEWTPPLLEFLLAIFGVRKWDRDEPYDRVVLRAIDQLRQAADQSLAAIPARITPTLTADEAILLWLRQVQSAAIVAPADEAAIELVGWLELPLDDAPAAIVCSVQEGCLPSSVNADLFLPNALRVQLGLQDNLRRYARDAYALSLLAATRQQLDLIVARRNLDGDPLPPSRLLFACDDATLIDRVGRFFQTAAASSERPPLAGPLQAKREQSTFRVPPPQPLAEPICELAVTSFRSYLACPYRFYLSRILKLRPVRDAVEELDGGGFGTLLHEVLRRFGSSDCRNASAAADIRGFLDQSLEQVADERFGRSVVPAVRIQVEQLRSRLHAFAELQAERAAEGWRIEHTEIPGEDHPPAEFIVDDRPMRLRGRIDRIDVRPETGECVILDYKSANAGKSPEKVHQTSGGWVDLQLPMYRHLIRSLGIAGPVRLGYVLLPKDVTAAAFCLAEWSADDLAAADEVAAGVIRNIRNEVFWPPTDPPPDFSEDFAAICQDGVFERNV